MKKSALIVLILLLSALLFSAAAEQVSYCDPVPQELNALLDETPQDCIVFHAPDGTTHACIISEYGYMLGGYRLVDGNWDPLPRAWIYRTAEISAQGLSGTGRISYVRTERPTGMTRGLMSPVTAAFMTVITGTGNTIPSAAGIIRTGTAVP